MAKNSDYILNLLSSKKIYTEETLPNNIDIDELVKFIDLDKDNKNWALHKTFKNNYKDLTTKTYTQYLNDGDYWCMRHTVLNNISIDKFRKDFIEKLNGSVFEEENGSYRLDNNDMPKRCMFEYEYIHSLITCLYLKMVFSENGNNMFVKIRNTYKLEPSWLLNQRTFCQWVFITKPFKSDCGKYEQSIVLSLRDVQKDVDNTKAYYISVEYLKYDIGNEELTWNMATCSDAGGNIPKFLQKSGIDKAIVDDVPSFLKFMKY